MASEPVEVLEPAENEFVVLLRPNENKYWKTSGLKIAVLRPDRLCRVIGSRMVKHLVHSYKLGLKPEGGAQKPLKEGTGRDEEADSGKRPKARGFTDRAIFVNSIRLKKISASKTKATYVIGTDKPEVFDEWLIDEASRGVDYFPVHGRMKELIDKAVNDTMNRLARAARGRTASLRGKQDSFGVNK